MIDFRPISFRSPEHHRFEDWQRTNLHGQERWHEHQWLASSRRSCKRCLPRRNRSSYWAFCSCRLTSLLKWVGILDDLVQSTSHSRVQHSFFGKSLPSIDREDVHSSTESTISTSLIHYIPSEGNRNKNSPGFWIFSSDMKTLNLWIICRTEDPIFAVFAVQP